MAANKLHYSNPEWHKRQARWRHNSFFGFCAMSYAQMNSIQLAGTVTPEAKATAAQIQLLLKQLELQLKERIDG